MFGCYSISYRIIVPEEKKYTPVSGCMVFVVRDHGNSNKGHFARKLLRSPPLEIVLRDFNPKYG
jgi:hypothetical protein